MFGCLKIKPVFMTTEVLSIIWVGIPLTMNATLMEFVPLTEKKLGLPFCKQYG